MAKTITRIKKTNTIVPDSIAQADELLGKLSSLQDSINEIEARLRREVAELKAKAKKDLEVLEGKRGVAINALFTFAHPRKAELTKKQRTVNLPCGVFGWRMTPPRVELECGIKDAIAVLKQTGNREFIRIKEEIDREALLEKKPVIEGISYEQNDEFFVVPNQKIDKPKTITRTIDRV